MELEDLRKKNEELQLQLALLQKELLFQQRRNKFRQYREEFAILPQIEPRVHSWKDEPDWDIEKRREIISSLDLFPYDFPPHKLLILSYDMFATLGLIEKFQIPEHKLKNFLMTLRDSYREVPFHNFYHAFNVAQTMYFLLTTCKVAEKFDPLEHLAMLLSAFCHDIDHPGVSNSFQCNAGTKKAILYNDFSVLEMHHCHETFKLLNLSETNILVNLSVTEQKQLRKYICSAILATDLAVHGDFISQLKIKYEKINWESMEDKKLLMCCLVKCADISNEIRPGNIGRRWAARVMAEFFTQCAIEKANNLPVLPHMDPEKTTIAASQVGFIGFLCLPFFQIVSTVFPGIKVCCDQMQTNKDNWQKIDDEAKAKKLKE